MAEDQNFYYGAVDFPLTSDTTNSLLRDADPAIYYALEFFAQVITTHLGDRLVAEATAVGATQITSAVAETLPIDPEQFLTEEHIRFPLLTLHRESTSYKFITKRRRANHKLKLAYILPPLRAAEAERLLPILHAVGSLIDQKAVQGRDPAYTPTAPVGTAGEFVWSNSRAGLASVEVKESSTGAFSASTDLFFPAIVMTVEMSELADSNACDGEYVSFEGADVEVDQRQDFDGTTLESVADFNTYQGPTITSVSPTSGSVDGNTLVTITGTRFKTGTRPSVLFDGAAADAVTVVSTTTITCRTPPHAAYPSFTADVLVIATDGQTVTLEDAFTFNND
jgi:hypothetical protein